MRNAPEPKEVAKVALESIKAAVVSARQKANKHNFFSYHVDKDAKLYAYTRRKMSHYELHSFVAKRILCRHAKKQRLIYPIVEMAA